MQITITARQILLTVLVILAIFGAYTLGQRNGLDEGWQSGADETAAIYQEQMAKLPQE